MLKLVKIENPIKVEKNNLNLKKDINEDIINEQEVKNNLYTLSSDEFDGRLVGTEGNLKAQEFIVNKFKEYGLKPYNQDSYLQEFKWQNIKANNVIGIVEGTDPDLKNEAIIVGAHFDHVGDTSQWFCFKVPGSDDKICNGADDNASGTVSMLELARLFAKYPTKRTIIFVGFNAEEEGLIGSKDLVSKIKKLLPNYNVKYVINIDMVGRNGDKPLTAAFDSKDPESFNTLKDTLNKFNSDNSFDIKEGKYFKYFPYSDHYSFYEQGFPVIMFFSLLHTDYHKVTDEANKIDLKLLTKRINSIYQVVNYLANTEGKKIS